MLRGIVAAALIAALGSSVALAQGDVIAQRKALMKAIGDGNRAPAAMLRGEQAFDLALVQAALRNIETAGRDGVKLFPDTSKTGGDTAALPKIWETKADFDAKMAKMEADAKVAMAKITDEASFKTEFPALLKNCGGCHTDYRARR